MNYINEILKIRKQRGVSVAKLSRLTGIPDDRIYKWEVGIGNPKAEDSVKLYQWLHGSDIIQEKPEEIHWLIGFKDYFNRRHCLTISETVVKQNCNNLPN